MEFKDKIRQVRINNNLTQQQFADKLSISRSVVAKWEQSRGMPSIDLLKKISETFDVSVEFLLCENDSNVVQIEKESSQSVKRKKIDKRHFLVPIFIIIAMILISVFVMPPIIWYSCGASAIGVETFSGEVTILDDSMEIKGNDDTLVLKKSLVKKLDIYDIENNPTTIDTIKTGNRVKVYYERYKKYTSGEGKKYVKVEIFDDYCMGETGLKGFFISTKEYYGDKPPIHYPEYGYENIEYAERGINSKYPYAIFKISFPSPTCIGAIESAGRKFSATIWDNSSVYFYILDNSEKGYSFYATLNSGNPSLNLPEVIWFDSSAENDYTKKYAHREKWTFEINTFYHQSEKLKIKEFDKNHNEIAVKSINSYDELYSLGDIFMLNDETRYFRIVYDTFGESNLYVVGDKIDLKIATASGFILRRTIQFV